MTQGRVSTFEASLERLEVGWTHTDAAGVAGVLETHCERPAVGTPLPFDVDLPPWVDTEPTAETLDAATTGITHAEFAVADYGSVFLPSTASGVEPVSLFPDLHVAVLRTDDILPGMPAAFERLGPRLRDDDISSGVFATGPSATADMGELVKGAHGPKDVHVVLLDDGEDDEHGGESGGGAADE